MYRVRFHGRGGQGMKTASRILGTAFFLQGYEVQDAPRYGAERRGAPIFAYVRSDLKPIKERGVIRCPDLAVVADDSLVPMPAAGVLAGLDRHTVLLINSHDSASTWAQRLNLAGPVLILPSLEEMVDRAEQPYVGAVCAGAAARLVGVIEQDAMAQAIREELGHLGKVVVGKNLERALTAFERMADFSGTVSPAEDLPASGWQPPAWVDLSFEPSRISAPTIHASDTSAKMRTGLWRTMRPVIDLERCNRCWWVCSTFCPDGAIAVSEQGEPRIDYDHCKGCLICVTQCPPHAIEAISEHLASASDDHAGEAV